MQATLVVQMNNAAFTDDPCHELACVLRYIASNLQAQIGPIDRYPAKFAALDSNGNTVGTLYIELQHRDKV